MYAAALDFHGDTNALGGPRRPRLIAPHLTLSSIEIPNPQRGDLDDDPNDGDLDNDPEDGDPGDGDPDDGDPGDGDLRNGNLGDGDPGGPQLLLPLSAMGDPPRRPPDMEDIEGMYDYSTFNYFEPGHRHK